MKNECKILGYRKAEKKETMEPLLIIYIAVPYDNENFKGFLPIKEIFLDYSDKLENTLNKAIENNCKAYYETTNNIITGKTKIINFYVEEKEELENYNWLENKE